jgi:hypothetical protein
LVNVYETVTGSPGPAEGGPLTVSATRSTPAKNGVEVAATLLFSFVSVTSRSGSTTAST